MVLIRLKRLSKRLIVSIVIALAVVHTIRIVLTSPNHDYDENVEIPLKSVKEDRNMAAFVEPEVVEKVKQPTSSQSIFCETTDLGCFKPAATNGHMTHNDMTLTWCANYCFKRNKQYAGITQAIKCVCGDRANQLVDLTLDGKCNVPCPGDEKENCGGSDSIRAYRLKGQCVNDSFTDDFAETRWRGCFSAPRPDAAFRFFSMAITTSQCLLTCERSYYPIAVVADSGSSCRCGHMTARFNLTQRLKDCDAVGAVKVYRTMVEDSRCGNIHLLPPGSYSKTLLASYPGSGNTWTRYLLEKATGIYTGSVFSDSNLYRDGLLGEMHSARGEFIKNHLFGNGRPGESRVVVVIRNPYRALLAYLNYLYSGGFHTGSLPQDFFLQPKYGKQTVTVDGNRTTLEGTKHSVVFAAITQQSIREPIRHWKAVPTQVIKSGKPYLIIYFEDIVSDPIGSVREMVNFASNPLLRPSDLESRLACLSQETTGQFKRKSKKFPFNPFKPEVAQMLNTAIVEVRQMLKNAGVKKELPPYEYDPDYAR